MLNLNEDNRIVMAQHPTDMRMGVNGMCGQVRKVGLEIPLNKKTREVLFASFSVVIMTHLCYLFGRGVVVE